MIRAIQTADNVIKHLPEDLPRHEDALLCEGAPIPPGFYSLKKLIMFCLNNFLFQNPLLDIGNLSNM